MRHLILRKALFHSKVREQLQYSPKEIQKGVGDAILKLQIGEKLSMPEARHMPSVSLGVEELRIKCSDGAYRVFYYMKSSKGILVFHMFRKKTQKTPQHEIEIGRKRLKEMLYEEN